MTEQTAQVKTNVQVDSLVKLAIFLEGFKHGRGGNISPMGTNDLDQLWNAIHYLKGDIRFKCERLEKIYK